MRAELRFTSPRIEGISERMTVVPHAPEALRARSEPFRSGKVGALGPARGCALGVALLALASLLQSAALATPITRYETTSRAGLAVTGNALGLAGTSAGPSTADELGAFIDATLVFQVPGWPLGTTLDWTLDSSAATLDLPAGAAVLYAELVWGGSVDSFLVAALDTPVKLRLPGGQTVDVAPDPVTASPANGTMRTANYYGRSANVTGIIGGAGGGAGVYRVSGVPAVITNTDDAAGWSLYVVYGSPALPPRKVALVTFFENVDTNSPTAPSTARIDGLCVPTAAPSRDARLAVSVMEGDPGNNGDAFRFARTEAGLAQNGARLAGLDGAVTNVFGGHITDLSGALDTRGTFGTANHSATAAVAGARQGWDLVTFDGSGQLATDWTSAFVRSTVGNDPHSLMAVGVSVAMRTPILDDFLRATPWVTVSPALAGPGDAVTVTTTITNIGDAGAANAVFSLPSLPAGLAYVAGTFRVNGAAVGGNASPVSGIALGSLAAGATWTVTFQLSVAADAAASLTISPQVSYANQVCVDALAPDVYSPIGATLTVAVCGDGQATGPEACDDANLQAGDGCDASCQIEYGFQCAGTPSTCATTCGDGRLAGGERCDDGNILPGDGCSAACAPERGYGCVANPGTPPLAGSPAQPDSLCAAVCGDGILAAGAEVCDDGNAASLDGCSGACTPESGWDCAPNPSSTSTPQRPDTLCVGTCGDGKIALGLETCDDANTASLDGCSSRCLVERGFTCPTVGLRCESVCGDGLRAVGAEACDDGDLDAGDGCSPTCFIEPGYDCAQGVEAPDSRCGFTCGDGRLAAPDEVCDDGNTDPDDGCSGTCTPELGWSCAPVPGTRTTCIEVCGDGRIVGAEVCDDGRATQATDGCRGDCRAIDHGWSCEGAPSVCTYACGDGLIALGVEGCDDENVLAGDGCSSTCEVERGYTCGDPPAEPSACEGSCGDGFVLDLEGCDDANLVSGDGCSTDCRVEPGWLCAELSADTESVCRRDRDEDGVLDDGDESGDPFDNPCVEGATERCDDNCPDFANADQSFPVDANGEPVSLLCPPYLGPRTQGGGGCGGAGGSWPALVLAGLLLVGGRLARRRAKALATFRQGAAALLVVASSGVTSHEVRAQDVDPRLFEAALAPSGILSLETTATRGHLRPWGGLIATWADDELVTRVSADQTTHGPLEDRAIVTLALGLGLGDRFDVALGVPLMVTSLAAPAIGSGGVGLGDLRVAARARLFGPAPGSDTSGFGLGLALEGTLPTGTEDFTGDGVPTLTPKLVLDYRSPFGLALALNIGFRHRAPVTVDDLEIADEVRFGVGAEVPLGVFGLALTAEVLASVGLGDSPHDGGGIAAREVPVEALGGLRWRSEGGIVATAAIGSGLTEGYGSPDFRVVLGLALFAAPPRPIDEPLVAAAKNRREDAWQDGPKDKPLPPPETLAADRFDQLAVADLDQDGDGIPTPKDKCPTVQEDFDGWQDDDGCLDPDNDGDGVLDADDKCPDAQETINGNDDDDGCPDEGRSIVTNVGPVLEIADKIKFKSGSAELLPSDKEILDQVASVLKAHAQTVKRVRIEGHTDNLGDREFNVDLAERRAGAVRLYLVEKGMAAERLFAKGFGSTRPVATNATEAGRAQNRRVEFHMLRDDEAPDGMTR